MNLSLEPGFRPTRYLEEIPVLGQVISSQENSSDPLISVRFSGRNNSIYFYNELIAGFGEMPKILIPSSDDPNVCFAVSSYDNQWLVTRLDGNCKKGKVLYKTKESIKEFYQYKEMKTIFLVLSLQNHHMITAISDSDSSAILWNRTIFHLPTTGRVSLHVVNDCLEVQHETWESSKIYSLANFGQKESFLKGWTRFIFSKLRDV